jgi:bifunctional N-acetylglucosamine-1-phosphate-uridyltransferase/glucosamine-1-phosphate-acetyltransferase GlmU-like protein
MQQVIVARAYPVAQEGSVASVVQSLLEFGSTLKILISTVANPENSGRSVLYGDRKVIGILEERFPSRMGRDPAVSKISIAIVLPAYVPL